MRISTYILIAAASIWMAVEGALILRDKARSKGTTRIDRMTRMFNSVSTALAVASPLLLLVLPSLQFESGELLSVTVAGTALICFGFSLRYWSVITLGKYFRTTVEIEQGHKVVKTGPYRYIRHPSYSGIILFFIGYGLLSQHWASLAIAAALPAAALIYRIRIEEQAMAGMIGAEYRDYQKKTKKLIPGIW